MGAEPNLYCHYADHVGTASLDREFIFNDPVSDISSVDDCYVETDREEMTDRAVWSRVLGLLQTDQSVYPVISESQKLNKK